MFATPQRIRHAIAQADWDRAMGVMSMLARGNLHIVQEQAFIGDDGRLRRSRRPWRPRLLGWCRTQRP